MSDADVQTDIPSARLTVEQYAAAVAAGSPTPGGGSVAAVVASLAAGLAEMVINLTLAGRSAAADSDALRSAAAGAARLRADLLGLATADEAAYRGFRAAVALPKSTESEVAARRAALDVALRRAADVPLLIGSTASEVLVLLGTVVDVSTKHALSDLAASALLAEAAVKAALLNVTVNAGSMRDQGVALNYLNEATDLQHGASERAADLLKRVGGRS